MPKSKAREVTLGLLAAKNSLENVGSFAESSMARARKKNPAGSLGVLKITQNLMDLKSSNQDMRKSAAGRLASTLKPRRKASACRHCGNALKPGAAFCTHCGGKTK